MDIIITPSNIKGAIYAPASKSYAQRAIAVAALANGTSVLTNLSMCDDTKAAMSVASKLGAELSLCARELTIRSSGLAIEHSVLDIGESGLSTRLFTPVASILSYPVTITGHGSIVSRPMDMMIKPLEDLGVNVKCSSGKLPFEVCGPMCGGEVSIDGSISSQFLTGLLISLPVTPLDSVVNVDSLRSRPYIDMTLDVIHSFGVSVTNENYEKFFIKGSQNYKPCTYNIEGDWSGASCLLVAGATAGEVTVANLNPRSSQADKAIIYALDYAGAVMSIEHDRVTVKKAPLKAFSFDATDCPDLFPALVALAAACEGESTILGTDRLTHKESDRAKTLKEVYGHMGIEIDLNYDRAMIIKGGKIEGRKSIYSHNDHRIAMSIATAALRASEPITITHAECVNKSYNEFYDDLSNLK